MDLLFFGEHGTLMEETREILLEQHKDLHINVSYEPNTAELTDDKMVLRFNAPFATKYERIKCAGATISEASVMVTLEANTFNKGWKADCTVDATDKVSPEILARKISSLIISENSLLESEYCD